MPALSFDFTRDDAAKAKIRDVIAALRTLDRR
jgi:hypothetical protein